MFFVVDVETSNQNPWMPDAYLLSVGIVPVTQEGEVLFNNYFYARIQSYLPAEWFVDSLPTENETLIWWRQQPQYAKEEAYSSPNALRYSMHEVARSMARYLETVEPTFDQRFLVANPSWFDMLWIQHLFGSTGVQMPFHHRALCLRSMKFGINTDDPVFGSERDGHKPEFEHVAWSDAFAEAKDLQDMIQFKQSIPAPRVYGAYRKFVERKNQEPDA